MASILKQLGTVITHRLERSAQPLRSFAKHAAEAADAALQGRSPTSRQLETILQLIATRCIQTILVPVDEPSKGALRDAAAAAGRDAVREVMGP